MPSCIYKVTTICVRWLPPSVNELLLLLPDPASDGEVGPEVRAVRVRHVALPAHAAVHRKVQACTTSTIRYGTVCPRSPLINSETYGKMETQKLVRTL